MNKTITIYELLGLIKDGKAPKIVKWEDYIFSFYDGDYLCKNKNFIKNHETNYLLCYLFSLPGSALNIKVEILEEDKHIIEEIEIARNDITYDDGAIDDDELVNNFIDVKDKLNEVIEFLNNKFNH